MKTCVTGRYSLPVRLITPPSNFFYNLNYYKDITNQETIHYKSRLDFNNNNLYEHKWISFFFYK